MVSNIDRLGRGQRYNDFREGALGKVGGPPEECDIMEAKIRKQFNSNGSGLGKIKTKNKWRG